MCLCAAASISLMSTWLRGCGFRGIFPIDINGNGGVFICCCCCCMPGGGLLTSHCFDGACGGGGKGGNGVSSTSLPPPSFTGSVTSFGGGTAGVMPTPLVTGGPNLLARVALAGFSQGIFPTIGAADFLDET